MRGRFAPSPTGLLHIGNLRTALAAHRSAAAQSGDLVVRMENLDPVTSSRHHEQAQLVDLAAIGIVSDGDVVRQSERFHLYRDAIGELASRGLVYSCYCTRREIREAAAAPQPDAAMGASADGAYPGTCRELSKHQVAVHERGGRAPALRLRTDGERYRVDDLIGGRFDGVVDDVVLQRNDGVPAYNLAVVIDDHLQRVTEVVRGDDLLSSTPRQLHLQRLLGFDAPAYAHVPLVIGPDGTRLAKRHGAVTLADLRDRGVTTDRVVSVLLHSLGVATDPLQWSAIPRDPWVFRIDRFEPVA